MKKILLVTGASRGIGAACARLAGRHGYTVCVNYFRSQGPADDVVASIIDAGGTAEAFQADVSRQAEVEALFAAIKERFGPVTHLVNNAGGVAPFGPIDKIDEAMLAEVWRLNITSMFLCAREAARHMKEAEAATQPAIVNMSSAAARLGGANVFMEYAASKGAIDTFTVGLAQELAPHGIRVNAVRPGLIETEIHAAGGDPDRVANLSHTVPMRRAGSADEVAETVIWLLSEAASYVTGTHVDVSGGR